MKNKKKNKFIKKFILVLIILLILLISISAFLLYGPNTYFRNTIITSFPNNHFIGYLFSKEMINEAKKCNYVIENRKNTDINLIKIAGKNEIKDNAKDLPESPDDGEHIIDGIGFQRLKKNRYNGWLINVYDPSRLQLAASKDIGLKGETTTSICKRLNALVAINAGAFVDNSGDGNGGQPLGVLMIDKKELSHHLESSYHNVIGINDKNILELKYVDKEAVSSINYKYAVEFCPFLIINSIKTKIIGNGGMGYAPRTVIGQKKDGTILFAVLDGRRLSGLGATLNDAQEIMSEAGAVNAANLDGGASTTIAYNGNLINKPTTTKAAGERDIPCAFIIKK